MKIAVASDHGGFQLKEAVKAGLAARGHEVLDLGTDSEASVDYAPFAVACAEAVVAGRDGILRGIVCCGTGIGVSIAANKVKGARCAVVTRDEYARLAAAHNHANLIALGGRFTAPEDALRYIEIWLETPWEGGRHDRRVAELDAML